LNQLRKHVGLRNELVFMPSPISLSQIEIEIEELVLLVEGAKCIFQLP